MMHHCLISYGLSINYGKHEVCSCGITCDGVEWFLTLSIVSRTLAFLARSPRHFQRQEPKVSYYFSI